jgi:hypothetical protein
MEDVRDESARKGVRGKDDGWKWREVWLDGRREGLMEADRA